MAKYEYALEGNFDDLLDRLHEDITKGSASATFEDGSDFIAGDVRVAVRVYERYSMIGSNRVSLSITIVGKDSDLHLSAIASGGSQAVFFKVNTLGEETFLEKTMETVEKYMAQNE